MNKKLIFETLITSIFMAFAIFSLLIGFVPSKEVSNNLSLFLVVNGVLLGFTAIWRLVYAK